MKHKNHYFEGKIKRGFMSLYLSKSIIRIASGLFGVFLPVFIYEYFDKNIQFLVLWYIAGSLLYLIFLGWGAIFMNKFGFRNALRLGSILGAVFYLSLFIADVTSFWTFIFSSLVALTLHRIFHWIPYHIDFAKFTDSKNRGKEIGLLEATTNIIGIFAPIIAGFILSIYGFNQLFLIVVIIYLLSVLPLLTIPKTHEKFSWGYLETWKQFFAKNRRKIIIAHAADGAEQGIGLVIWPIFIFELLKGNYLQIGILAAFVTGVTVILQLIVGKYADKKFIRKRFLKYGSLLYSIGWVSKIFVVTAFHIFIADAYHRFIKIFMRIPFDAFKYEATADNGHLVDEVTIINEMAIHIGKAMMFISVFVFSFYFSLNITFILAALASILLNFVQSQKLLVRNQS